MTSSTHTYTGYYDPTTGKGHSGQMMKIGQNLEWMTYWTGSFPFINVIKGGKTDNYAVPGTLDANGYPDASGGGYWRHYTHAPLAGWMSEGTVDEPWVLRWEGTGDVTWSGGTEIPGTTPNRREYTSLALPTTNYYTVATGDVTKLELLAPGEEARFDAGNILHSRFVADLAGADVVRMLHSLVDDNGNRDVSDFTPYDYINWNMRLSPNGLVQVNRGLPTQVACEIANELDANIHYNVPHQVTDAAATYIGQQQALHFDFSGGKKVKIELANAVWNYAPGFPDAWSWFAYGEAPAQEGTFDPVTATCTSVGHNMATGTKIACFNNIHHTDWPFAAGGEFYVIAETVDTFRLSRTEAAALRGADVLDDTDADHKESYIPDVSATFLRFKQTALNTKMQAVNYAERAMQVWDLIGAEIGEENMEVIAGCRASDVKFMLQGLEVPGYRERVMTSGQFYFAAYWTSVFIADDFENYTNEQHADYAIDVWMADGGEWHSKIESHIEALGCYNFSAYECGDHNGNQDIISQAKVDKLISLARDPVEGMRIIDHSFRRLSELGIKVATNFKAHEYYNRDSIRGSVFGSMEHQGDTDAAQYLGIKPFLDLGGVPK
ncbi:MAG: hypothetical protein GY814_12895 [Gammaproteobacteria bacterium]|nr:hypothetical protein [Gammaproteobacteria bacterium]